MSFNSSRKDIVLNFGLFLYWQPSQCQASTTFLVSCPNGMAMFTSSYRLSKLEQTSHCRKRSYVNPYVYSLCYSEGGLCYLSIAEGRYPSSRSSSLGIHPFLVPSKDFSYLGPNYQTVLGQCFLYSLIPYHLKGTWIQTHLRGARLEYQSASGTWSVANSCRHINGLAVPAVQRGLHFFAVLHCQSRWMGQRALLEAVWPRRQQGRVVRVPPAGLFPVVIVSTPRVRL